jgi:hypothetical protein
MATTGVHLTRIVTDIAQRTTGRHICKQAIIDLRCRKAMRKTRTRHRDKYREGQKKPTELIS